MPRRRKLTREEVADFFAYTDPPKRKSSPYDAKYKRNTYRLREGTHEALLRIAKDNGVGVNDLVRWILDTLVAAYDRGDVRLPIEEYVVTRSRLSL